MAMHVASPGTSSPAGLSAISPAVSISTSSSPGAGTQEIREALISSWLDQGYDMRVVMPWPVMQHILQKFGFVPSLKYFQDHYVDPVEVWYRSVD